MHTDLYTPEERAEVERRLAAHADHLRLLHTEGAGRAYALLPAPSVSPNTGVQP